MKFSKETMKGAAEIIVLAELNKLGEAYGYRLLKSISESSDNTFTFQIGTLYPLLYRLEAKGFVKSKIKLAKSGKERRYYSLTASGKKNLTAKTKEYGFFAKGMKTLLEPHG